MLQCIESEGIILHFIDLEELLTNEFSIYAHKNGTERELLEEHIKRCEYYFKVIYDQKNLEYAVTQFGKILGFKEGEFVIHFLKDLLFQMIVFHDLGKCNPLYQKRKMQNLNIGDDYDIVCGTEHSMLSSIMYIDFFWNKIEKTSIDKLEKKRLKVIVAEHAYVISRHHGNLNGFGKYVKKLKGLEVKEIISALRKNFVPGYRGLRYLEEHTIDKVLNDRIYKGKNRLSREQNCIKYFYYRMVYSLLVACDYYATTEFMNHMKYINVGEALQIDEFKASYEKSKVMQSIRKYEREQYSVIKRDGLQTKQMNELRSEIFLDVERTLKESQEYSIFFLEAPTGSGKTNISINASFQLMEQGNKLMYIYPFNTLVEQTKKTLHNLFADEELQKQIVVVNSLMPIAVDEDYSEDEEEYYQKSLLDRQFLNYPLILSTHVSFFNLLFGHKKEDVFGFFQLSKAVIVLDEIQSYKNEIWTEIIIMLKACAKLMNMKIIIMSATLPRLEQLGGDDEGIKYLLGDSQIYFQHPVFQKRVSEVSFELLDEKITMEKLLKHVIRTSKENNQRKILIEFITKKSAYQFYKLLSEQQDLGMQIKCLTGDDSLYEREKVLKPIMENSLMGVILVATQVIEAGVDIDMDIGYKNISKLDSEEQFFGRINRSCNKKGKVYFFDLDEARMIYQNDCRMTEELTLKSHQMREILTNKNFEKYYAEVFELLKDVRNEHTGREGLKYFFDYYVQRLNYLEVSKRMKLIEDDQWHINIVVCREIIFEDGTFLNGEEVWNKYKELLKNPNISYGKRRVELSIVRSQLNYFTYQIRRNPNLAYDDMIGELYCIKDGEKFFENGKINLEKLEKQNSLFL